MRPPELSIGLTTSNWPWKSFKPRIWTSTGLGGRGDGLTARAAGANAVRARARSAASAKARRSLGVRIT